jgi:hypothetical protein
VPLMHLLCMCARVYLTARCAQHLW